VSSVPQPVDGPQRIVQISSLPSGSFRAVLDVVCDETRVQRLLGISVARQETPLVGFERIVSRFTPTVDCALEGS